MSLWLCLDLSLTILRLGTPLLQLRLVPPALSGSSFPTAPPWSCVALDPQRPSGFPPLYRSPEPSALPWPYGSSLRPLLISSSSLPLAPPPPALPHWSALPPPWILPPSAPPWFVIMAVAWIPLGCSCSKSLLLSPWLLPESDPPCLLLIPSVRGAICPTHGLSVCLFPPSPMCSH